GGGGTGGGVGGGGGDGGGADFVAEEQGFAAVVALEGDAQGGTGGRIGVGGAAVDKGAHAQGVEPVDGEFDVELAGAGDDGGLELPAVASAADAHAQIGGVLQTERTGLEHRDAEHGVGAQFVEGERQAAHEAEADDVHA